MSARMVRLGDMEDIGASLETCIVCGSGDIVSQHVVTFRGREFAMTVASWCEKPECEEDRRLTVLSVGMLPPDSLTPAIDPDDEALVERMVLWLYRHSMRARGYPDSKWPDDCPEAFREDWRAEARDALKAVTQ